MHRILPIFLVIVAFSLLSAISTNAKEPLKAVVTKHANGEKKLVYSVNEKGEREGAYSAYYEDGKRRGKAVYRKGKLHGSFITYGTNGKMQIRANYSEGKLNGLKTEFDAQGKQVRTTTWKNGIKHGPLRELDGRRVIRDELWSNGQLLIPRSVAIIRQTLAEIGRMPIKTVGQWPADMPESIKGVVASVESQLAREQAVRMLMGYRYLCDLPWRDIVLDRTYIAHTEAASQLLLKVGKLTHTPENPGLPEAEYQFGYRGTSRSNIHYSSRGKVSEIPNTVKGYMDDSDPSNIERVGHRRWCLNPKMLKTGFGSSGIYSAMYSFDRSREEVPDFDFIAFPTPGMTPVAWFKRHYAWNISLNPSKYSAPEQEKVKARIYPARYNAKTGKVDKAAAPLPMNMLKVSNTGMGIRYCIIFRPVLEAINPGASYVVEITGVKDASGEEVLIEYLVVFFQLNQ